MRFLVRTGALWRDGRRRRVALAACLALGLGFGSPAAALDPRKAITQYAHQVWKTD